MELAKGVPCLLRQIGALVVLAFVTPLGAQIGPRVAPAPLDVPAAPAAASSSIRIDLQLSPVPVDTLVLAEPVVVAAFRFKGLRTVRADELLQVLSAWVGRPLSSADLGQAMHQVTERLRTRGLLLAYAYAPRQAISNGVVEVVVVEGRIGDIALDVVDGTRVRRGVVERFLETVQPGETIRRDNVEHSLLLLNDLPGTRVDASFSTGVRQETADASIRVSNDGNAVSGSFAVDNAGLRSVGEYRADLSLRVASPFNLGDLLTVGALQSSGGGQTVGVLTYGLPVNGLGTRVGVRLAEQRYRLRKEFAVLDAHGEDNGVTWMASHPLLRRSDRNLTLALSYSRFAFDDRLDAVGFRSEVRHDVTALGLAYDNRDGWMGGGVNLIQAQYLAGKATQENQVLAALDSSPGGLGVYGPFSLLRARVQREQAVATDVSAYFSLTAQAASKNLDAGPELAFGGPDAVRGYPVGELYADEGYVARLEIRKGLRLVAGSRTTLSAFFDQGRARINKDPFPGDPANVRSMGSYGVGVAHVQGRLFSIQTWLAWRTGEPSVSAPDRTPRGWVSMVVWF